MKKERIALLAAVLALGMIFAGCGKKDNRDVTQYCTVTFIMPDGTKETRRVKKGESLTDYPELKIEGYTATWDGEFSNIDLVEYGNAKVDAGLPIFNYSVSCDSANREPLFSELYPGSLNDVSQLICMIDKAHG